MSATNTNSASSSISTFRLKGLLEKDKLNGLNFMDWLRNLRLVLWMEGKSRAIEEPLPAEPGARATTQVQDEFEKRRAESVEVACLMLATMIPELRKGLESLGSFDMLSHLKDKFQVKSRQERFDTVKALVSCRMATGSSISAHVLKMEGYLGNLERLGFPICQELASDLIRGSLTSSSYTFVPNYNVNIMENTVMEHHGMLKTAKSGMAKSAASVLAIREGGIKKKKGSKGKGKAVDSNAKPKPKGVASSSSKIPQAKDPKEDSCFHYEEKDIGGVPVLYT